MKSVPRGVLPSAHFGVTTMFAMRLPGIPRALRRAQAVVPRSVRADDSELATGDGVMGLSLTHVFSASSRQYSEDRDAAFNGN